MKSSHRSFAPKLLLLAAILLGPAMPAATAPADSPPGLAAARALYEARKFPEAKVAFEKLAAAEPTSAAAHFYLGVLARERGDFTGAVKHLERATERAPHMADYLVELGDAYGESAMHAPVWSKFGLAKKCLAAYQRAAEIDPNHLRCRQCLFEYYRQAPGFMGGGKEKAAAEAAILLKLDPRRGHAAFVTLYADERKFPDAYRHAAELRKLDSRRGREVFVSLYVREKKFAEAFAEFEAALKHTPDDYMALYGLGHLAATTGQLLDRGSAALQRCLELTPGKDQPSHATVHWRLGQIREKQGDRDGARAAYHNALRLDATFRPAIESLKAMP